MNSRLFLAPLLACSLTACTEDSDPDETGNGSTSANPNDDSSTSDPGEAETEGDVEGEGDTPGGDTEPDGGDSSTGDTELPNDCSCYAEPMETKFTGCRDLAEVFLGCEQPAQNCGEFWSVYETVLDDPDADAPAEAAAALRCTIEALSGDTHPLFTWSEDPDDPYSGSSEYLPLPDGTLGRYYCNTTNEGGHGASVTALVDADTLADCLTPLDADPLTIGDYDQALECLSDHLGDPTGDALAECG